MALCGGLALVGCVGITDPATNVGQTTARLNAHGRTDDTSAHFYFRYANQEADLPTAAAKRTPTRTVPAHRPDSGEFGYFGENVTGLSSGRTYFFELCGGDDKPGVPDWCGGRQEFFTDPSSSNDWVEAGFGDPRAPGFLWTTIRAASGPQGQDAGGELVTQRAFVVYSGRVTCLKVTTQNFTKRAAIGVVGAYTSENPPRPASVLVTLSTTLFEPSRYNLVEQSPDCDHADFSNPLEQDSGITIHDAN